MSTLGSPSRTAILSAVGRWLHCAGPGPHVLDDPWAFALAGEEGVELAAQLRAELPPDQLLSFSRWTAARARFVEDTLAGGIAAGVRQCVILGAGLDSFAYRRRELLDEVQVFEVDHPASQEWKRGRLEALRLDVPGGLRFVSVDFEHETLPERLRQGGFDPKQPAVFSWIGVTMYLSLDAVGTTLQSIASCAPGTRVVLSYDMPPGALSGLRLGVRESLAKIVSQLGEPFVTMFEPAEIESLLRRAGFTDIAHFGPADAAHMYFREDGIAVGGSQRLAVATVA